VDASAPLTIRPVTVDDTELLLGLHIAVRASAFEGIEPDHPLLRQRFVAEEANHRALHPAATHHVIELERRPIGQCRIGPHPDPATGAAPDGDALVLVDLTVLPEHAELAGDVVAALHRHVEWFGARLCADGT
jgi:hypothetical protein